MRGLTNRRCFCQGVFEASRGVAFWEPGNADEAAAAGRRLREEAARQQQLERRQAAATEAQGAYKLGQSSEHSFPAASHGINHTVSCIDRVPVRL
jgi:predicted Fe-S protein YdhL (DUF1289 family)